MNRQAVDDALGAIDDWEPDLVTAGVIVGDVRVTHGPADTVLPVASLTKPMTAWGVLIAVQQGLVHLDEPVTVDDNDEHGTNENAITVRHLLAHASGLPVESDGPRSRPATRRIYSNWGYDIVGELVAERVGEPFADVLRHEIFEPLGMSATRLEGSPARAIVSTVDDMLEFARELREPQLISSDLDRQATTVAFGDLDGVLPGFGRQRPNPWGLGVEIRGTKQPHWAGRAVGEQAFGHFGQSGSMLIVDRTRNFACVSLADRPFGPWAGRRWPELIDGLIHAVDEN